MFYSVPAYSAKSTLTKEYDAASMLAKQSKYREAFDALEKLIPKARKAKHLKTIERASYLRARMLMRLWKVEDALKGFEKIIKDFPGGGLYSSSLYQRARCLEMLGRKKEALKAYKKVIVKGKSAGLKKGSLLSAARIYALSGNWKRAEANVAVYLKRYKRGKTVDKAKRYMAWIRYRSGKHSKAIKTISAYKSAFPSDMRDYWTAVSLLKLKKEKEGVKILKRLAAKRPPGYYGTLATMRLKGKLPAYKGPSYMIVKKWQPRSKELLKKLKEAEINPNAKGFDLLRSADKLVALSKSKKLDDASKLDLAIALNTLERYPYSRRLAARLLKKSLHKYSTENDSLWRLYYPRAYPAHVNKSCAGLKLEVSLVYSIMVQESAMKPAVKSYVGATGLMQLIPPTARSVATSLGIKATEELDLTDPALNIQLGTTYIAEMKKNFSKYSTSTIPAIAAYNAGPEIVEIWLRDMPNHTPDEFVEDIPYDETRNYVKRVISLWATYDMLYGTEKNMRGLSIPVHSKMKPPPPKPPKKPAQKPGQKPK